MNLAMQFEKIITPPRSIMAPNNLSKSLLGVKSPKPTVEIEVIAKYIAIIVNLPDEVSSRRPWPS